MGGSTRRRLGVPGRDHTGVAPLDDALRAPCARAHTRGVRRKPHRVGTWLVLCPGRRDTTAAYRTSFWDSRFSPFGFYRSRKDGCDHSSCAESANSRQPEGKDCGKDETTPARLRGPGWLRYRHTRAGMAPTRRGVRLGDGDSGRADVQSGRCKTASPPKGRLGEGLRRSRSVSPVESAPGIPNTPTGCTGSAGTGASSGST